jgi:hypothetical protein
MHAVSILAGLPGVSEDARVVVREAGEAIQKQGTLRLDRRVAVVLAMTVHAFNVS